MREFNKPNVKASRYRPEVYSLLNKKFFDKFKNKYPKYKDMTNLELRNIIKKFASYHLQVRKSKQVLTYINV